MIDLGLSLSSPEQTGHHWPPPALAAEDVASSALYGPAALLDFTGNRYAISDIPVADIASADLAALTSISRKPIKDVLTFTRAGTATYVDVDGLLKTAAANQPRFDYTHGKRQLLLEGPATNLVRYSSLRTPDWSTSGTVHTQGTSTDRFGAPASIIELDDGALFLAVNGLTVGATYTITIWIRTPNEDHVGRRLSVRKPGVGTGGEATAFTVSSEWRRVIVTGVAALQGYNFLIGNRRAVELTYDGPTSFIANIQLEAGPTATSFIPTNGTMVTRAADQARLAEPVAALLRRGTASVLLQGEAVHGPSGRLLSGSLTTDFILAITSDSQRIAGGYPLLNIGTSVAPPLPSFGLSVGWDGTMMTGSYQGGSVQSRSGTQEAGLSSLYLGRNASGSFAFGWFDQLAIWPFRMTDEELRRLAVPHA